MSQPQDVPPSLRPDDAPPSATTRTDSVSSSSPSTVHPGSQGWSIIQLRDLDGPRDGGGLADLPPGLAGRYDLLGRIGQGGMGEVLLGRDPTLGRDLALKVMLERSAHDPDAMQRFREEAQIGGQLQHPGVVPVYELGNLSDGRPFFTMKLVKGQTLAKLLHERSDPGQDRPRFLKVFEQVCQTMAYAHAKGVLHRDLKPANIMVGAFGEVQVMDWGLAKVMGTAPGQDRTESLPGEAIPSVVRVDRSGTSASDTREGDVFGTPAYMPPEQALGEIDRLDERCDVFSLGAILCEVLTGRPPYHGRDVHAVLRKARRAELAEALAALDDCGADAELIALAKRCLAAEPGERLRHAGVVAAAVEAYLSSVELRVRQAEMERAAAQAREEEATATAAAERRARRLTLTLAASMLLLVAAGGSAAWLVQQQRAESMARSQRANDRAQGMIEQTRSLLVEAWQSADERRLAECLVPHR